ncbi:sialate O-acetylesterase [Paraflavitalea pollutisoli]|uniref:sialate O-acetylesterase n=1 Tax=Paraflavitalea pollutisoli TaxID=3034143 RepID=UPI0023EC16E4|nr:sialate O-acetylesterase [Paraflavitalea sp. H1-2-19X]
MIRLFTNTLQTSRLLPAALAITTLLGTQTTSAQVKLPRLVRDSMILQRDTKVSLWGWASPKEKVTVRFNNKRYTTTTAADGKWRLWLAPTPAGGPYMMEIAGSNKIELKDILVGDVYLCAGQSNMVHQMNLHSVRYANDIATANNPQIRQFWIPYVNDMNATRADLAGGNWKWANPEDVRNFSAVAYFFARDINERYKVPIGIINASIGGTPIESWISEEALQTFPNFVSTIQRNRDTAYINTLQRNASAANKPGPVKDKGLTGLQHWYDPAYQPKAWRDIAIPGYWEDQGIKDLNGTIWYRREIDIPASMTGKEARVFLGRIHDADVLYINGKQVGNTTYLYPQRRYNVPAGLLKAGKNTFAIRVSNFNGKGGFVSDKPYYVFAGNDTVSLTGYWQYKVGEVFEPVTNPVPPPVAAQNQPMANYNGMIAPILNYTLKGFCWYQGETNAGRPDEYARLQPALIADWRSRWNQGELPFLFVQLPGYMDVNYRPEESSWATFREAQRKSLSIPNTGMAVAIDLGEWNDVHPDNKKSVGDRLALAARAIVYGEKGFEYSGPIYESASVEGNKIVISFTHTGGGLIALDNEPLSNFAIAGADKKFVWATARIENGKVVVSSDQVTQPKYVRYAWSDNPDNPNLGNQERLPASPFRTDQ